MPAMFRTGVAAFVILAAATLSGCGPKKAEAVAAKPSITVSTAVVGTQSLPRQLDASGSVAAWQQIPVASEAGGLETVAVLVDEGSRVRQGQILLKLDDRLLRAQLRQQDAQLASANAVLAQQTAALNRAQELAGKGYLSKAGLDTAVANQKTAQANVQAAAAAQGETRTRLEQTNIRAPVSGLITARSVVKGQVVSVGTELFRLVRDDQLEMNAQIPEQDLALVRQGTTARVTGEPNLSTVGVVRLVTPQVDPQTRLGLARITLPRGSGFKAGAFAKAVIDEGNIPALVVPQQAIVYREGKPGVYLIAANNRAHFAPVTTGARVGDLIEVSGLQAGARVAVQGAGFLGEGELVSVGAPRLNAAPVASVKR